MVEIVAQREKAMTRRIGLSLNVQDVELESLLKKLTRILVGLADITLKLVVAG